MAILYPEGECFFKRSALSNKGFSADKPEDFYSNMLVEFIWNQPAFTGPAAWEPHGHPRSYKTSVDITTRYAWFTQLPFSYGPTYTDIKRRFQHNLCTSPGRLQNRINGAAAEVNLSSHILRPFSPADVLQAWFMVMCFRPGSW